MNRTANVPLVALVHTCLCAASIAAQQDRAQSPAPAQEATVSALVADLRAQEAAARTVRLELETEGRLPAGLNFHSSGSMRVLRAEQGGVTAVHAVVDYALDDRIEGHIDSLKTPDGVLVLEQNPTFGEVFVRIDKSIVADLEWAGAVLQRNDLPGLGDSRAMAPLGSTMLADLAQRYQLAELSHKDKNGQAGTWYGGDLRPGPGLEGDVPLADHVEVFLRDGDHALLEVVHLQKGQVVQRIKVKQIVVGEPMPLESFKLDDKGKRPIEVKDHAPMWQEIEELLQRAEQRAAEQKEKGERKPGEELPPSKRKK